MGESISEDEANKTFQSPPRRRRSTFFEKRESLVPQPMSENDDPNVYKQNTEASEKYDELKKYHDKLLVEKELWKKEVKSRRNKYHDLRQQYSMAVAAPGRSRISYSALSNEDIEFLKGKVNISKLVDSHQKLHQSVKELRAFYKRTHYLDEVILTECEEKIDSITEYIMENSTIEPSD